MGTEEGEDIAWLEDYEDLELFVTSEFFDEIGNQEGRSVSLSLSVEERDHTDIDGERKVFWITAGRVQA